MRYYHTSRLHSQKTGVQPVKTRATRYRVEPVKRCCRNDQHYGRRRARENAYDDAHDGDEGEDEGHVSLRPAERVIHGERADSVPAAKNSDE